MDGRYKKRSPIVAVTVDLDDAGSVYREAYDAPVISFIDASDGTSEQTDWFDLTVQVDDQHDTTDETCAPRRHRDVAGCFG